MALDEDEPDFIGLGCVEDAAPEPDFCALDAIVELESMDGIGEPDVGNSGEPDVGIGEPDGEPKTPPTTRKRKFPHLPGLCS